MKVRNDDDRLSSGTITEKLLNIPLLVKSIT